MFLLVDSQSIIKHLLIESRLCKVVSLIEIYMKKEIKSDDIIFNFFKQICNEKDDIKCVQLGNSWILAMEKNLSNIESNLDESDIINHKMNIQSNRNHLKTLKNKNPTEWRNYATQCMIEIMESKNDES